MARAIIKDPETMNGIPVFRGTRVPVQTLFDYQEGGDTLEEFLQGFPTVPAEAAGFDVLITVDQNDGHAVTGKVGDADRIRRRVHRSGIGRGADVDWDATQCCYPGSWFPAGSAGLNSVRSHARAAFQSRSTVSEEIPNTSAVSSTPSPTKKRSSTTRALRASSASS
jgi:hypothetical protein